MPSSLMLEAGQHLRTSCSSPSAVRHPPLTSKGLSIAEEVSRPTPIRHLQAGVLIGIAGGDAAAGSAHHEPLLDEKRLEDVFDRAALLAQCSRETFHTHGPPFELFDDGEQKL